MTIEQIIFNLTPFIVYGVGELIKVVKPKVKGVVLLMVLAASSGIIAWVNELATSPDTSGLLQFGFGLLAIVVNQFFKQLKSGN